MPDGEVLSRGSLVMQTLLQWVNI